MRDHYCNNLRSHRDSLAALDRIEAEQVDLTAQRDHYQREFDRIEAEVERLRATKQVDEQALEDAANRALNLEMQNRDAYAEVERLRAALEFIAMHEGDVQHYARNALAEEKV
jgi:hypothetical protein